MADLSKVQPGRGLRIPAADYNAMIDAARAHQASQFNGGSRPAFQPRAADIIKVKNGTDAARQRYEVLAVSSPIVTPTAGASEFKRQVALTATTPASGDEGLWVVLLDPLAPGAIGRAIAAGVAQVRIDVTAGTASYEQAEMSAGAYNLVLSSTGSAKVLWRESGTTGEKWAVVRLGATAAASSTSDETAYGFPQTERDYFTFPSMSGGTAGSMFRWRDGSGTVAETFVAAAELAHGGTHFVSDASSLLVEDCYYLLPFVAKRSSVVRFALASETGVGSVNLRMGVYSDHYTQSGGGIHYPDELLHEEDTFSWTQADPALGGSSGLRISATFSLSLTARAMYWMCVCMNYATNPEFSRINNTDLLPTLGYQCARVDATLQNFVTPMVGLRYTSGGVTIPTAAFPNPFTGSPSSPTSGVNFIVGTAAIGASSEQVVPAPLIAYGP